VEISKKEENVTKQSSTLTDEEITQINDGRNLYNAKCATCHDLYSPSSKTKEQWSQIVPDMAKRSQESNNKISYKEEQYILKFLQQGNTR
ncbi:MAG: hypothetical protein KA275_09325, partial [Chitinophagaceae bacterium]|nr:hypothetical protein [Chitinophagaceae bacterium]